MLSRLAFSFFALAAVLALVVAEQAPHRRHHANELAKRGGRNGRGTYYTPGLGNCGGHNTEKDMIVALPTAAYSNGKHCYKKIKITNKKNKKSCIATVVDSCPDCPPNALDMSPAIFKAMGVPKSDGVMTIDWDLV